ncbi:uncharacterized protein LOC116013601 [Ipomoea triloba]|uniref:uncharacterized protein LOC116013601 n=1 Tax=Ipomoea triloba TaxID=35885 RepID=UPI00125D180A|nr:uncharacterized protein LOC116013601 [Ipomoea triloba]
MSSVHNSVDTVNAAATAIVSAETRTQPDTIPKKKWGSCWSHYWCFGSYKHKKRIGHATLVPEPTEPVATAPISENPNHSASSIVIPFIAPPSSPASFLLSDPPSATQSPAGLLSLKSLSFNAYSPGGTASIFTIGPYAHETQLVTPPVFSAVTTEPSTACFTPPPESTQLTTPPSPEVPFAQLLTSSLACNRRNSGTNLQFSLSQYEFQPYQYPGSPGSRLISPGSVVSNSGTSSPFTDRCAIVELCKGEAPKYLGYEHFSTRKWGSRVGSGSLTPNGWGSRLGSGTQTPNGGLSRLGSGTVTPNGAEPPSRDSYFPESQISEVASLANSDNGYEDEDIAVAHHRVSFELTGEEVPSCREKENAMSPDAIPEPSENNASLQISSCQADWLKGAENSYQSCVEESTNTIPGNALEGGGEQHCQKHRNITLGSSKDFDFDLFSQILPTEPEVLDKSAVDCEWWTSDKATEKESDVQKTWTFFPVLKHHEVS